MRLNITVPQFYVHAFISLCLSSSFLWVRPFQSIFSSATYLVIREIFPLFFQFLLICPPLSSRQTLSSRWETIKQPTKSNTSKLLFLCALWSIRFFQLFERTYVSKTSTTFIEIKALFSLLHFVVFSIRTDSCCSMSFSKTKVNFDPLHFSIHSVYICDRFFTFVSSINCSEIKGREWKKKLW